MSTIFKAWLLQIAKTFVIGFGTMFILFTLYYVTVGSRPTGIFLSIIHSAGVILGIGFGLVPFANKRKSKK